MTCPCLLDGIQLVAATAEGMCGDGKNKQGKVEAGPTGRGPVPNNQIRITTSSDQVHSGRAALDLSGPFQPLQAQIKLLVDGKNDLVLQLQQVCRSAIVKWERTTQFVSCVGLETKGEKGKGGE